MEVIKFGDWTFIEIVKNKHGKNDYKCECKCGIIKVVDRKNLLTGRSKRCANCRSKDMSMAEFMIGKKFGKYLVLEKANTNNKDTHYKCLCDCGKYKTVRGTDLRKGNSHQCHSCALNSQIKHGMVNSKSYSAWKSMRQRCNNKNTKAFMLYGGRGIIVCERWNSFNNFYEDMGDLPFKGAQLDRINNDGNYEPSNCRWVTAKENINNRRCSRKGEIKYIYIKKEKLCERCLPIGDSNV